jgi:hypothetical protein
MALAVILVAGCAPTTQSPVGTSAGPVADQALFGSWKSERAENGKVETAYLFILPGDDRGVKGVLITIEDNALDGGFITFTGLQGLAGPHRFLNSTDHQENGKPIGPARMAYTPWLYRVTPDGNLHLSALSSDAARIAIERGGLPGTIDESGMVADVNITAEPFALDAFFARNASSLFPEEIAVFRRVENAR